MALLTPKDIREHTFQTVRFKEGYDVDEVDDFLDQVNGMTTALYHENGSLLYGENPIAAAGMLAFEDGVCRTIRSVLAVE